ncbi:MAG: BON domain-containing protein [Candidatus Sulfotelmatobacter sp.]
MRTKAITFLASFLFLASLSPAAQDAQRDQPSAKSQERITREVRRELLMLPYFDVFDYIAYKVDGGTVTLFGQVVRPSLKSDAQNVVKRIEGVEKVDNQIEVLPPSSMDDRLRIRLFRAIYQYPPLQKYELGVQKPIRILVKNGRATLEGVVDSESDKNLVGVRANGVSGLFSVTNNLQVAEPR